MEQLAGCGWRASGRLLLVFEQLIYAMRADLGHNDKELSTGDLLRVFINDIDEYLPAVEPHKAV